MAGIAGIEIAPDAQDRSRRNLARLAGFLYLGYIVLFAFATFIQHKPFVWDDPAAMARNIADSELMIRIGFMSTIVADLLFLSTAWALYVLLKPVGKNLALLFVLLNLAGVVVECVYTLIHFESLLLLGRSDYLQAFKPDQLQALSMYFLRLGGSSDMINTLFYGVWLFPLGYLVFNSGFLPRFLGVLLLLDGFEPDDLFHSALPLPRLRKTDLSTVSGHVHCGVRISYVAHHQGSKRAERRELQLTSARMFPIWVSVGLGAPPLSRSLRKGVNAA
jgi:hypothetical protein